jgi:hypothetical protein
LEYLFHSKLYSLFFTIHKTRKLLNRSQGLWILFEFRLFLCCGEYCIRPIAVFWKIENCFHLLKYLHSVGFAILMRFQCKILLVLVKFMVQAKEWSFTKIILTKQMWMIKTEWNLPYFEKITINLFLLRPSHESINFFQRQKY